MSEKKNKILSRLLGEITDDLPKEPGEWHGSADGVVTVERYARSQMHKPGLKWVYSRYGKEVSRHNSIEEVWALWDRDAANPPYFWLGADA